MLTFETLLKYLNIEQKQIDKLYETNENKMIETSNLPESFINISNEFDNYYYLSNSEKFLEAIFYIIDKDFMMELDKEKYINETRKILVYNLDKSYQLYGYNKTRKIKKNDLQKHLNNFDEELNEYLRQYVADYFGINIIIFILSDDDDNIISNIEYIYAKNDVDEINLYKSTILLINKDNKWYPILNNSYNNILLYSTNNILQNIHDNKNNKNDKKLKSFKKMLLKELQELAQEKGINIMKENDKYKNKIELYDELKNI